MLRCVRPFVSSRTINYGLGRTQLSLPHRDIYVISWGYVQNGIELKWNYRVALRFTSLAPNKATLWPSNCRETTYIPYIYRIGNALDLYSINMVGRPRGALYRAHVARGGIIQFSFSLVSILIQILLNNGGEIQILFMHLSKTNLVLEEEGTGWPLRTSSSRNINGDPVS